MNALSASHYPLEHFYIGQSPTLGDGKFEQAVLAASPGITREEIDRLTARYGIQRNGVVQSFSILRDTQPGRFFAVHIQRGANGQPLAHYIVLPSEVIRGAQGNLRAFLRLLDVTAPAFSPTRQVLSAILMPQVGTSSTADQTSDILNLLTIIKNKMDVLEALLSAVVQGVRLVIQNAPVDITQRTTLIEGLLALLPPSVRFAVTFVGDVGFHHEVEAQVCFVREMVTATDVVRFDWESGQVFGMPLKDDYSRFTISQLRLDTSLVIERTRAMHLPAAWYLSEGRKLADALNYASYRLKIDQALMSGQPVNKEDVADILTKDPTLSDSLRANYARYLLRMATAMQSAGEAAPIGELFEKVPDLEREAFDQLNQSIDSGGASGVFRVISGWFARGVNLPNRTRWSQLAQKAAIAATQTLAKNRDLAGIAALTDDINASSHVLDLKLVSRPLLETLIPFATQGTDLAERIFLLVATLLDVETARQFLASPSLRGLLPSQLITFVSTLEPSAPEPPPNNSLLINAARSLGGQWEGLLITQFALWARRSKRITLIDEPALGSLARLALEPNVMLRTRIRVVFDQLTTEEVNALGTRGGLYLMRIRLAVGDYEGLVATMVQQARLFYLGEAQIKYLYVIERAFSETPNIPESAWKAIKYLSENGIQNAPLAMAGLGALTDRTPHPSLDELADLVAKTVRGSLNMLEVIPPAAMMKLTVYNIKAGRSKPAIEAAGWVSACATKQDKHSIETFKMMVEQLGRGGLVTPVGQDLLRAAARQIDPSEVPQLTAYLSREFSAEFSAQFENTAYLNGVLLGRDLPNYLRVAQAAWPLLAAAQALYATPNKTPTEEQLDALLGRLEGSAIGQDREDLIEGINEMCRVLVAVSDAKRNAKPRGKDPAATVDIIRTIGTALAGERPAPALPPGQPFGVPNKQALRQATTAVTALAARMVRPVPAGMSARAFKTELDSLINALQPGDAAQVRERAAVLAPLVRAMVEIGAGNQNKVTEGSPYARKLDIGKQRPRNALEFFRYMAGFLSRKR